jgi:hypothetical protein
MVELLALSLRMNDSTAYFSIAFAYSTNPDEMVKTIPLWAYWKIPPMKGVRIQN